MQAGQLQGQALFSQTSGRRQRESGAAYRPGVLLLSPSVEWAWGSLTPFTESSHHISSSKSEIPTISIFESCFP